MKKLMIVIILVCPLLVFAIEKEIINNGSYIHSGNTYDECFNRSLMIAAIEENIGFEEIFCKRVQILQESSNRTTNFKIPKISHHIWITTKDNPQDINKQCLQYIRSTLNKLKKSNGWRNILWTNNKSLIQNTISNLDNYNIEVKEINSSNIKNFKDIQNIYHKSFQYNMAMPSDIISYVILEEYGGVYFDVDYELKQSLDKLTEKYSFIAHEEPMKNLYIGNAFIAASAHHPIIRKSINLIYRNFSNSAPKYVLRACHDRAFTILAVGPVVMSLAFHEKANSSLKYNDFFITDNINLYQGIDFTTHKSIGTHYGENTWKQDNEEEIYPYCKKCIKYYHKL